ncbi:MAG TPA: BTAD domain-containing putative transcriptional regulator [Mycobacteriales bacterium]|nr:BTAD domain-containing putative transcriptional regulator [Mycobacteriales bacterium]
MLFRVLGPLEVETAGVPAVPPGPRPRALLTALLLQPNTVVPAYRLAEAVWGEDPPEQFHRALHQVVARVRRALGPASRAVVTRPPGYLLVAGESSIDASCFEARYRAARARAAVDPGAAAVLLDEALALWRGPAYGEFADGFARPAAIRLEELRVVALEDRAALLLACGWPAEAAASAGDLAAREPLRERPVEVLMRALYAAGRSGEALEAFRRYRDDVASELGLDPTPGLRDLEVRILRDDLEAPRRVRVEVPTRPVPPPDPHVRALPWRPSTLVGREHELLRLAESLATRRLVTVVGPGGVGKTRLALEVAHHVVEQGRTVWWADLTTVTAQRVVAALAEATGTEIPLGEDPAAALCAALRARRGVLCLDNAEHLLGPLAAVVERLLASAPDLVVLATSRERLALDAESVRVLAPLPLPDGADRDNPAMRLFVARAPGLDPAALADEEVRLIAEVCRRLDGMPLAIELGAARAATFGLAELAERLGERLDLLGGGRRTAALRHRTLRAVMDWSHELLTDDEARLFYRLSVFPGPFSLDQVESVCADEPSARTAIAGLVARLVEQSLVQTGQGRFWLLETLQAYARERLDAVGETRRLRERHARDTAARLAGLDRQLWSPAEETAVAALTGLVVDLHAAWDHARTHDRSLAVQLAGDVYDFAYIRQRLDLLDWGVRVASWDIAHPRLPRALAAAAAAAWAGGRLDEAEEHAARAVAAAGEHPTSAARAVAQQGNLAMFKGRTAEALAYFRAAAQLHREADEHVRALADEVSIAQVLTYAGRSAEARRIMEDVLPRARRAANPSLLSWAHYIAGEATAGTDVERALACYAAAIECGNQADCRLFVMLARSFSVALAARDGAPAAALDQFGKILEQWDRLGNELAELWALRFLVVLLDRVDASWDAAVLAGALLAAQDRYPKFGPYGAPVESALAHVRDRLGPSATDGALAEGARLGYPETVAHARRAIRSARQVITADVPT